MQKNGKLVTFGIKPTHPEIGYGYLELSSNNLDHFGTSDVVKFLKSQILLGAKHMMSAGHFL